MVGAATDIPEHLFTYTRLIFPDLSHTVFSLPQPDDATADDIEIFQRITTPYNISAFENALRTLDIEDEFLFLIQNLRHGFPIANPPILDHNIIMPSRSDVDEDPLAREYVRTELEAGRISGPFKQESRVEAILCGHFVCSPLVIAESDQGPGVPPKRRVCRHLSKADKAGFKSVNALVDKTLFPTTFDDAHRLAEAVSLPSIYMFFLLGISTDLSSWHGSFFPAHVLSSHTRFLSSATWLLSSATWLLPSAILSSRRYGYFLLRFFLLGDTVISSWCFFSMIRFFLLGVASIHARASRSALTSPQIAHAPADTTACSFDLKSFHRTIPVHPSHKHLLVFKIGSDFYIDHCAPFGLASASSNAGQVGGAIARIWTLRLGGNGLVLRYEDDFSALRFPTCTLSHGEIFELVRDLGAPWHEGKCGTSFEGTFRSIGFVWNVQERLVWSPADKLVKYTSRVQRALSAAMVSLHELQQIHGTLIHIHFVQRDGSSRLPGISNAFRFFHDEFERRHLSTSAREALEWWSIRLSSPTTVSRPLRPLQPARDFDLFVDASTSWGIGILIDTQWFAMRLKDNWRRDGTRDIAWLEAAALEVQLLFLAQLGFRDSHLLIHSDNTVAIGALSKGRSPNAELNRIARRFLDLSISLSIETTIIYIESAQNPADAVSRGFLPPVAPLVPSFDLPHDLVLSLRPLE